MEISIKIKDGVTKNLAEAEKRIPLALFRGVGDAIEIVRDQAKLNVMTGGSSGLHVRTGTGRRSITHEGPKRVGSKIIGRVGPAGPGSDYMLTHEFGATITPKRAKFLAIPLGPAKTPSGAPSRPGPRDYPDTFVRRSRAGKLIIFRKVGKQAIPLFALVKRAVIPKRPWLRPAAEKSVPKIVIAISRRIKEVLK